MRIHSINRFVLNKKILFIVISICYIASQVLGTFAIKSFFIQYKIKELSPRLDYFVTEIANGNLEISKNSDIILIAYDVYGNKMDVFKEESKAQLEVDEGNIDTFLSNYLPKVISGNPLASIKKIEQQEGASVVIGKPITKNRVIIGAAFLIKPASDFNAILSGFYWIFFITFMMGMLIIGILIYKYFQENKSLEQMRRNYIANISHELKSPLTSIKALTETLLDDIVNDDETKERYYSIILSESNHLQKMITDMLELSKLQSGKGAYKTDTIDINTILEHVKLKYDFVMKEVGIEFEITDQTLNLPLLETNRERIIQVLNILMDNAIKFTNASGKITIDSMVKHKKVIIKVIDTGIGIEEASLPYIFERFYKTEQPQNTSGTGLGLAIAKTILEELGEKISVNSHLGKGSVFSFTIKRAH